MRIGASPAVQLIMHLKCPCATVFKVTDGVGFLLHLRIHNCVSHQLLAGTAQQMPGLTLAAEIHMIYASGVYNTHAAIQTYQNTTCCCNKH